ncbi:hypothetical protein, partial [Mixta calida]|uniref:hypothetical protein n=1 Tax=Mixta calida TaxID=665913 RepID=UPI0028AB790D
CWHDAARQKEGRAKPALSEKRTLLLGLDSRGMSYPLLSHCVEQYSYIMRCQRQAVFLNDLPTGSP